ncbi:pilus assembly protein PilO [Sphaerospermopsis aphanizomenoides BCCUSP55]|uniref:GspMb/PilO family protein n=1 Tax=Sphaerospermopsis aphanizomenoides TaxID=459663 RepID=UPI000B138931|nr:GspMb/PilO family protein [Sphaerospermopsis aphanizomenoides]MBK1990742.1 pilus assembly protein PilO [Sphaerospermopsis aphanizomenoides BCCUSP55]
MTLSDDLNFSQQNTNFDDVASSYPVAFGITFTPKIIGIVVGMIGVAATGYMIMNMVMPAWDNFQQLQTKSTDLQGQVDQKRLQAKQADKVKTELADAKKQQVQVLALFANEKSLDTLLMDTSRLVDSSNAQVIASNAVRAKLKRFVPAADKAEIITDNSLGEKVNNKLKRRLIKVEIEGNFEQTQSIMRNIERLQPLLLVQNYDSKLVPPEVEKTEEKKKEVRTGIGKLSTSFDLVALMPLTAEETAELAAKAAPPAQ